MVNKYLALQKDVFDISKVTVVGSPTITSDGVASVTPSRDALHFYNFSEVASTHDWDLYLPFTVTQDLINRTNNTWLYRIDDICLGQWYTNSIFQIYLRDKVEETVNVFSVNLGTFNPNINDKVIIHIKHSVSAKTIFAELIVNGSSANSLSKNYTGTLSWKNTEIVTNTSSSWSLPEGSIEYDLPSFKTYVDGQLVYSPTKPTYLLERRKEGYDPSKFTIVGSPTITEYGVASNLSQASYFTAPFIDFKDKAFSFKARVKFTDFTGVRNVIFGQRGKDLILPSLCLEGNKLRVYRPTDGTTYDSWTVTTFTPQINTWYDVELIMDLSNFIVKINGDEVVKKASSGITFDIGSNVVCLGTTLNLTSWKLDGSIDLPSFSITADGKEAFTGAKENYYMLRR